MCRWALKELRPLESGHQIVKQFDAGNFVVGLKPREASFGAI
jgi:hypothetical protein